MQNLHFCIFLFWQLVQNTENVCQEKVGKGSSLQRHMNDGAIESIVKLFLANRHPVKNNIKENGP